MLPLLEESRSDGPDDLVKVEDVRVEVMRARGAGGQVRLRIFVLPFLLHRTKLRVCNMIIAREQNGIRRTPHPYTDWDHCLDAGRTKSTSGTSHMEVRKLALHPTHRINDEHSKFCGRG